MIDAVSDWSAKILLVDDEPSITDLGETVLEKESDRFQIDKASNGEAGLEVIRDETRQIDGVISDYEMPLMDGLELLKQVRAEDENLPFFIYTGRGSEEIVSKAVKYNVDNYQQKSNSAIDEWKMMGNEMLERIDGYKKNSMIEAMMAFSYDIITVLDTEGTIIYSSKASRDLLGHPPEERLGDSAMNYIHPDDREKIMEKLELVVDPDQENKIEANFRYRTKDGEYVNLEAKASYQPGKFDGIIVNSRQTTDREVI